MPEYAATLLLHTPTVTAWNCSCRGLCRGKAAEEQSAATHLTFPQRGVYVHSVGRHDIVADRNHVVVINEQQPFQVSHPVPGGDETLSVSIDRATLLELTPPEYRNARGLAALNVSGLRIDTRTQLLATAVHQRLVKGSIDRLEAESRLLELVRHTLGDTGAHTPRQHHGHLERLADRAKLLLATDPGRRWTLSEVADAVGVTPVYLTDVFRRVEGVPLYRYQMRIRLASALHLLADHDDLSSLAIELGFASHSHFTAAFRRTYGVTPSAFQKSIGAAA